MAIDVNGSRGVSNVNLHAEAVSSGSAPPVDSTSVLPVPAALDRDVETAIAELTINNQYERRKNDRAARDVAEKAIASANRNELAAMRESADRKYEAAMVKAVATTAAGAISLASAAAPAAGEAMRNYLVAGAGKYGEGTSKMIEGTSGIWAAGAERAGTKADVRARAAVQSANSLDRMARDAIDDDKSAREDAQKAIDFLKQYQEAKNQCTMAALTRV